MKDGQGFPDCLFFTGEIEYTEENNKGRVLIDEEKVGN